ncbi:YdcF family protein [Fulvivirga kasyanovii]|uniref:YdcF family protein n=1 Tax=Fulvivirga kasyanovii TaxID=396812 RepID=A0ABW9RUT0_9BACT|nr:YdcF family protein [Fulvivirga kasyanovii]MTI27984.1 YdcF family protein [Fulvivirga kasyanovii]
MKKYLIIGISLFVTWYLFNTYRIYLYSTKYYDQKSDVAIVLGAGTNEGKLSPVFKERVNHAINLYQQGIVDHIIFTGGFGEGQSMSDSKAAMLYAVEEGVPEAKMFIEEKSCITFENLKNAKILMDNHGMKTALIVSDPLHMKRAMRISDSHGINGKPSPTPTSMYRSWDAKLDALVYESFYYNLNLLFRH